MLARIGSPSQPSASPAIVIPSCVVAIERSRCSSDPSNSRARDWPLAASCSTRVRRTPTNENSAATNRPFTKISSPMATSPMAIIHESDTGR